MTSAGEQGGQYASHSLTQEFDRNRSSSLGANWRLSEAEARMDSDGVVPFSRNIIFIDWQV